ncbi:MAG: DUF1294 domain-containing protein [Tissierella sp.]|uniref:DUF1294 domain-containing protein n=1 Tax=Tissierella sp. TaxID=41274 RepID=UPI003F96F88A
MDLLESFLWIYFLIINMISFICFYMDKKRSRKNMWRISESFLIGISFIGGSLGSMIGMKMFHHKTRKKKFIFGIPILFLINILTLFYIKQFLIK